VALGVMQYDRNPVIPVMLAGGTGLTRAPVENALIESVGRRLGPAMTPNCPTANGLTLHPADTVR
jgi:hypothetical protein